MGRFLAPIILDKTFVTAYWNFGLLSPDVFQRNICQRASCRPGPRINSTSGRQTDFSQWNFGLLSPDVFQRNICQRALCRPGPRTNSTSERQTDFSHGRDESFYQSALDFRLKKLPRFGGVTPPPTPSTPPTFARCTIFYKHFGGGISDPVLK